MAAWASGDPNTQTIAVSRSWAAPASHVHAQILLHPSLAWHVNVDQGFRAPNLDDLTSRQQIGPGFQYENPNLKPEKSLTYETGLRWSQGIFDASAFGFYTQIFDLIARAPRDVMDCPIGDSGPGACKSAAYRFSLQNLPGHARVFGAEVAIRANWRDRIIADSNVSYARGDTPNPLASSQQTPSSTPLADRVPLSRVPPLHGMAEISWHTPIRLRVGGSMRWALAQTRLAISDLSDSRIPKGGTPGYGVFDMRIQYPFPHGELAVSLENLFDAPYRIHGSSINGARRSANAVLRLRC